MTSWPLLFFSFSLAMGQETNLLVHAGNSVHLDCPMDSSTWIGPDNECLLNEKQGLVVNASSVFINNFGYGDRGRYTCVDNNASHVFEVALDPQYRAHMYYVSLLVALATAFGFLVLVVAAKFFYYLLNTYGCCLFCCCCKDRLPPKAQRLKGALDSIEAYRQQQLDKLRESYNLQTEWISQNCAVQMERVRCNYSSQVQNLRDIRKYGTNQLSSVRDQYYDQMAQIRDYSTAQLERVHENYIFQRQRLRKFSNQHYCRVRSATGEYTQRTLNRVMDNLPPLGLDLSTCRTKDVDTNSIEEGPNVDLILEAEAHFLRQEPNFEARLFTNDEDKMSYKSNYMTPPETPHDIEVKTDCNGVKKMDGGIIAPRKSVGFKTHKKSRSFSHYLPQRWLFGGSIEADDGNSEDHCDAKKVVVEAVIEHNRAQDSDEDESHEQERLLANSEEKSGNLESANNNDSENIAISKKREECKRDKE